ncbi:MAG: AMP-binding protein, partial [Deltaproteobacteria bacterium]|nr:AMP-binding protein [Deltaproteobacteria bacterium]
MTTPWLDLEFIARLKAHNLWSEALESSVSPVGLADVFNSEASYALDLDSPLSACPPLTPPPALARALALWRLNRLTRTLKLAQSAAFYASWPAVKEALKFLASVNYAEDEADKLVARLSEALSFLPLTDPLSLADGPNLFLAVSQSDVAGVVSVPTSGSTGQAKRIYSTETDLRNVIDFYYYGMRNLVNPGQGDRVALLMSGTRPGSVGDLLSRALGRWPIECLVPGFAPLGRPEFSEWFQKLVEAKPTCLVGVPAQVLALANHDLASEKALSQTVRRVLLSGDVAPLSLVNGIERGLTQAKVFLHYGQTEFGLGGAVECPFRRGPHFREADIILEILDPKGRSKGPGEIGEMVLTALSREAMPLIRYRTGDLGAFVPGSCACGSVFRRIRTYGRLVDRVVWPDGESLDLYKIGEILYGLEGFLTFKALS